MYIITELLMNKLNDPIIFVPVLIVAVIALILCAGSFRRKSAARDSIILNEKDKQEMTDAFRDGSAYGSGAPAGPAAPAGK